jgi:hypothetical protein
VTFHNVTCNSCTEGVNNMAHYTRVIPEYKSVVINERKLYLSTQFYVTTK